MAERVTKRQREILGLLAMGRAVSVPHYGNGRTPFRRLQEAGLIRLYTMAGFTGSPWVAELTDEGRRIAKELGP